MMGCTIVCFLFFRAYLSLDFSSRSLRIQGGIINTRNPKHPKSLSALDSPWGTERAMHSRFRGIGGAGPANKRVRRRQGVMTKGLWLLLYLLQLLLLLVLVLLELELELLLL